MAKKPETLNPFARGDAAAADGDLDDVDADGDAAQRQSLLARRGVATKASTQTKADSPSKARRVGAHWWRVGSLRRALPLALVFVLGLAIGAALYSHIDTGMSDIRDALAAARRAKRNTALLSVDGASAVSRVASDAFQLRAMTFNLRYGTAKDGADSWRYRRAHAADMINRHAPVVVGTQEGVAFQLAELQALLARPYERFGDPREPHGEHVQILYDASVVKRLDGGTFWLSETPHAPGSKGWDGVCVRVATWCRFRLLATGQVFYHVNTHLDSQGAVARFEGAKVLWREMEQVLARDALPATTPLLLTGDFNTFRPSNAFQFLTKDAQGPQLQDAWLAAEHRIGNISCTFHEFLGPKYDTLVHADWPDPDMDPLNGVATNHIDFILVRPPLTTLVIEVITEAWNGRYPSDHYPVISTLLFPSPAELPPPKAR